ncbi:MAG TPA: winged helix DNA-binding domain-containing protein [Chloroflexia bacterium]|nr:winged helix DNA-binding domain-containing protein [Chloroflexia bacterium]
MVIKETVTQLSWPQVRAWRLKRQYLNARVSETEMLEVVSMLCGLHAQLMSSAELTLWARIENLHPERVQKALWEERSLVKSWAMRGTLHLFPAQEYGLWQTALTTFRHYLKDSWLRYFGVTREELEQLIAMVAQALDDRILTRQELAEEVARLSGSAELAEKLRESWGAMLKPVTYRGLLCFGPSSGQNVRFTRPDQWLNGSASKLEFTGAEAMLEVLRRFLASYGPVEREDFARWFGISRAEAARLIKQLGQEICVVEVEGLKSWLLTAHLAEIQEASSEGNVRLLPAFDQYVIGTTRQAEYILPGPFKERIYRQQGWISPVILVDGRMEGVWRHEIKGKRVEVQLEPFGEMPSSVKHVAEQEAERLAVYLGKPLELLWK